MMMKSEETQQAAYMGTGLLLPKIFSSVNKILLLAKE